MSDKRRGYKSDIEETAIVPAPFAEPTTDRPYRVAVHGYELHRALEIVFGSSISLHNNVFIWPFKHFVTYETQIRQRLKDLEALSKQAADAAVTNRKAHKSRPSIELDDEVIEEMGEYLSDGSASPKQVKDNQAVKLRDQLRCLVEFMDQDMQDIFDVQRKVADGSLQSIAFQHLWLLYKPGDMLFCGVSQRRAYRVLHVTGGRAILDVGDQPSSEAHPTSQQPRSWEQHEDQGLTHPHSRYTPFVIDCFYIDFDGENFGPVPRRFIIQEYEGEQPINSLHAFPSKFDPNCNEVEKMLLKRGKKFFKLAGVSHKKYTGLSAREPSVKDHQDEVGRLQNSFI